MRYAAHFLICVVAKPACAGDAVAYQIDPAHTGRAWFKANDHEQDMGQHLGGDIDDSRCKGVGSWNAAQRDGAGAYRIPSKLCQG